MTAVARLMADGQRLHLQHGPSDLIVWAEGARDTAFRAAAARFETIIAEVVAELDLLRQRLTPGCPAPTGAVAQRMFAAAMPFAPMLHVTPMAAVAGAIADEVLKAMTDAADLTRAYVNNGGDIALHLSPGATFRTAMMGHDGKDLGRIEISAGDGIGGIATSGRHGRSLSLGIADSVSVLGRDAAGADVAATLIANAVDIAGHPGIARRPACEVDPNSDLGDEPVVVGCAPLTDANCAQALAAGLDRARSFEAQNRIVSAALFLQDQALATGPHLRLPSPAPSHQTASYQMPSCHVPSQREIPHVPA